MDGGRSGKKRKENEEHLRAKGLIEETDELDWHLLHSLMKFKKLTSRGKGLALQIIADSVPTREWMHKRGFPVEPECECGQTDSRGPA